MNEFKQKLLKFISENYDDVVKPAKNGEYIEIDVIPDSDGRLHELHEFLDRMFTRSYPQDIGDGIRMGRYFYFMQKSTKDILSDLKNLKN